MALAIVTVAPLGMLAPHGSTGGNVESGVFRVVGLMGNLPQIVSLCRHAVEYPYCPVMRRSYVTDSESECLR
jgi:hypothetical protein